MPRAARAGRHGSKRIEETKGSLEAGKGLIPRCNRKNTINVTPDFFDAVFALKGRHSSKSPGWSERSERNPGHGLFRDSSSPARAIQFIRFVRKYAVFLIELGRPDRACRNGERRPRVPLASLAAPWAAGTGRPFQGQDQNKPHETFAAFDHD